LFRDLLVDERRSDESGTNDIRTDAVLGTFLRYDLCKADKAVFGCDVRRFQYRSFFECTEPM
jgi:hypothetical protein